MTGITSVQNRKSDSLDFIERSVGDKRILWFKNCNRYMLLEMPAYQVIIMLGKGKTRDEIIQWSSHFFNLPLTESKRFIDEIVQLVDKHTVTAGNETLPFTQLYDQYIPLRYHFIHHYQINGFIYAAKYETEELKHLIHPKFAHLEVILNQPPDHIFQVFQNQEKMVLNVNGKVIGRWDLGDGHYLSGKFSMELLNRIYGKTETDWIGVFHASAISYENKCVLFLGDSGDGKSTVCAVLMAMGFNLVADDFVPVNSLNRTVFSFPAAVSVKKSAVAPLLHLYPVLEDASEYCYPEMEKTVRFLPPAQQSENSPSGYYCKALVFVKYINHSGMTIEKLPSDIAFQKLVPDSWISPIEENASRFLDWFLELPCYQLTYSDNDKMVTAIQNLFNDDLQ